MATKNSTKKKKPTAKAAAKKPAAKKPATKKKTTTTKKRPAATKKKTTTTKKRPAATKKKATTTKKRPAATKKKTAATKKKTAATKKKKRKTTGRKSPFGTKFVESQRQELQAERAKYLHQAETLKEEADQLVADREPGDVQFDEESGDGDTIAVERERDLTLSAQAQESVRQIDEALERIDQGTYGICVISGDAIPKARLEAIPWAAERVEHKVGRLGT